MNVEEFRKSGSYKEHVIGCQLTDIETKLNKKRGELKSLYKRLDKLNDKRIKLEEKRKKLEDEKKLCMGIIFRLVEEQKRLTDNN
jgi:cell division protein FtsB